MILVVLRTKRALKAQRPTAPSSATSASSRTQTLPKASPRGGVGAGGPQRLAHGPLGPPRHAHGPLGSPRHAHADLAKTIEGNHVATRGTTGQDDGRGRVRKTGRLDVSFANAITGSFSVMLAIKCVSEAMRRTSGSKPSFSGSIIATASVAGLRSGIGSYSASKAAVVNLCQTAAWQLEGTGERINAICPAVDRDRDDGGGVLRRESEGHSGQDWQLKPLLGPGDSEEIAEVVGFLASGSRRM
ncbi:hypothetical protein BJ742DRAFT_744380 [Cladochytrium replicatum]|nr:hypothetical protein BJ742DRAFT_744380 [Cladochytrium replicatum]